MVTHESVPRLAIGNDCNVWAVDCGYLVLHQKRTDDRRGTKRI